MIIVPRWAVFWIYGAQMKQGDAAKHPENFEEARRWAEKRAAETGVSPKLVSNPNKLLTFDLENRTVTRGVWDEDNNLVEMTYCAVTGNVLKKTITKPSPAKG
jgi:hypothetical protein